MNDWPSHSLLLNIRSISPSTARNKQGTASVVGKKSKTSSSSKSTSKMPPTSKISLASNTLSKSNTVNKESIKRRKGAVAMSKKDSNRKFAKPKPASS